MILHLIIILILCFLTRNYSSQDKLKFWLLVFLVITFFKKPILNMYHKNIVSDDFTNSIIAKPMLLYAQSNKDADNKFNNFTNKLFTVENRNTTSQNNTKNKNIN